MLANFLTFCILEKLQHTSEVNAVLQRYLVLSLDFPMLKTSLLAKPHLKYSSDIKRSVNLSAKVGANCEVLCT